MATSVIKPMNSQGTKIFVLPVPASTFADCAAAVVAIHGGKQVMCPQSLGDITQTRSVTEYKCLSSNDSVKIMGAISRGNLTVGMLYDPTDALGQKTLVDAFENNTPVIVGIELPDNPSTDKAKGNGTIKWFKGAISEESMPIEMDAAILYNVTIEVSSAITTCPAVKVP